MNSSIFLSLLAASLIGAGSALAGDNDAADATVKKPIARRTAPVSSATPAVRRDSRQPASAPAYLDVRIARARPAAPWSPGAPGD